MQVIVNAAPGVIQNGTHDLSTTTPPRAVAPIPQHVPKFFIFSKKGPLTEQLAVGADLVNYYGADTFDLRKKFANHSTVYVNGVNATGNMMMIKRLMPPDAKPAANLVLCLDVLKTMIPQYQRNADGSFTLDVLGNKIVAGPAVAGHSVQWLLVDRSTLIGAPAIGKLTLADVANVVPARTDAVLLTTSVVYPIFEFDASSFGAWGNDIGMRIWAPTAVTGNMPTVMMQAERAYPIVFSMVERLTPTSAPVLKFTQSGDTSVMTVVKPGTIDPTTDQMLYVGDRLINSYRNISDLRFPIDYGNFGGIAVHQANIDLLLASFQAAEVPFLTPGSDFTAAPTDMYLFNFLGGVSSQNVPYHSYQFITTSQSVQPTQLTNLMAQGGADGTMNDTVHAALVETEMAAYLDPMSPLQEVATNVESIIYDTGFPVTTKRALCNIIGLRKDTAVVLGTYVAGQPIMTAAEEASLAIMLRTRLQLFPESDFFGTPVMRGLIVGHSAQVVASQYTGRLPLTYEIAIKSARYMGAGNGAWKGDFVFDSAPGSVITEMYNISNTNVPFTVRNKNWDAGLNWVQAFDTRSFFFPALKTVYVGDTSVLNSYFTVLAICYLNKVANKAWRQFTGISKLTNAQLAVAVDEFISAEVKDRFDQRFIVVPATYFTNADILNGFSWTTPIKLYAPNMKTVMTTYLEANRMGAATAAVA